MIDILCDITNNCKTVSFYFDFSHFYFFMHFRFIWKKSVFVGSSKIEIVVATANNITNNQAPVPSVCVRVPHSPSLDSGENSTPGSPVEKAHHDFATLVVREFVKPKTNQKQRNFSHKKLFFLVSLLNFSLCLHANKLLFCCVHSCSSYIYLPLLFSSSFDPTCLGSFQIELLLN